MDYNQNNKLWLPLLLLVACLLATAWYLFSEDTHAEQRVQIFLPEGYCEGFTVFYEHDLESLSKNTIRVGDTPSIPVNVFNWSGKKGVLIHVATDDLAVGIWFYYFNTESATTRLTEFRKVRIYSSAEEFEIRPLGDSCGDDIVWNDDARDPNKHLRHLRESLRESN